MSYGDDGNAIEHPKGTNPEREAKSLVIYDQGDRFDSYDQHAPLPWHGTRTPRAWVVDISTKTVTGYYQGELQHITLRKDGRKYADNGRQTLGDDGVRQWIASLTKSPDAAPPPTASAGIAPKDGGTSNRPMGASTENTTLTVGSFNVDVPSAWKPWGPDESRQFNKQFQEQQEEIYRQYTGGRVDPTRTLSARLYRTPTGGNFICTVISIPPQADLMGNLKKQLPEKARWGIQKGLIKRVSM